MKKDIVNLRLRKLFSRRRGFSLLETVMVLSLLALFSLVIVQYLQDNATKMRAKAVADKINEISSATEQYVKANYSTLHSSAPIAGSGVLVIPVAKTAVGGPIPNGPGGLKSIQGGGFLAPSFIDVNAFNQNHLVLVRRCGCATDALEVMVTSTGGRVMPDSLLGVAVSSLGASAGFVPTNYVDATDTGMVLGAFGGWRTPTSSWNNQVSAGHLQQTLAFQDGALLADYLYRTDIGIPEANTMHTAINMDGNDIKGAGAITANTVHTSLDVWADQDVRATRDVIGGRNVTAGQDVSAGRDLTAQRNLVVLGDGAVSGNMHVEKDATISGSATVSTDLTVDGIGKINDLKATYLDAGAIVYRDASSTFPYDKATASAQGIRLGDLLPKLVPQYSYRVQEASLVVKPTCANGDYTKARIMIYRQTESNSSQPSVPLTVTHNELGDVVDVYQDLPNSYVVVANAIVAIDNGLTWTVHWLGTDAFAGATRQAIAQTYCYYGT